eukprot:sb/3477812/
MLDLKVKVLPYAPHRLVGECVYSLKEIVDASSLDVKTNLKDPTGKASDSFIGFKLEYMKPSLDPDERAENKAGVVTDPGSSGSGDEGAGGRAGGGKKGILKFPKP